MGKIIEFPGGDEPPEGDSLTNTKPSGGDVVDLRSAAIEKRTKVMITNLNAELKLRLAETIREYGHRINLDDLQKQLLDLATEIVQTLSDSGKISEAQAAISIASRLELLNALKKQIIVDQQLQDDIFKMIDGQISSVFIKLKNTGK